VEVFLLSTIISAPPVRANLRTFIKRIRKKFRDGDPSFDQIENYPGFGYRWTARK
jgi:DNA-binding winged helix-turn-helix (wHTH) protein